MKSRISTKRSWSGSSRKILNFLSVPPKNVGQSFVDHMKRPTPSRPPRVSLGVDPVLTYVPPGARYASDALKRDGSKIPTASKMALNLGEGGFDERVRCRGPLV
jgi:hypothetical protein